MSAFPVISQHRMLERLSHPQRKVRIVLDTDTFNEIDDQFAVVYALKSPERIQVEAFYAAPFTTTCRQARRTAWKKASANCIASPRSSRK
ncbi:hypothetical protein [Gordoniibacillus kamchatkensis]|uniref:hypothetical protein n=1 Tax=Gordoniibacillus kamchatkensis TaxID=1590651 RepID=UPI000AE2C9C6|nr:hypothetical protein [Paenibacillus sp. VKM B-2647]